MLSEPQTPVYFRTSREGMRTLATLATTVRLQTRGLLSSPTVRVVSRVSGGNILAVAIGLFGSLVQARFVGPEVLGYLRQFSIVTSYAFFLSLGIWHALERRYPLYIGQGRRSEALAVAEICRSWNLALAGLASGVFGLMALGAFLGGNWHAGLAWLVQVVMMVSTLYGGYLGATYRSGHDFVTAAKSGVWSALAGLVTLPLLLLWPYTALVIRSSIPNLVSLAYLHIRRPLRLHWRFDRREWWVLIKEGLPLFTASYGLNVGWLAIEASLVLACFGARALGLWSASLMVLQAARIVPQAIVSIYVPRLTEQYGRTGNVLVCLRMCKKPMLLGGAATFALVLVSWCVIPIMVPWVIPKYTEAVSVVCLMMLQLPAIVLQMPLTLLIARGNVVQMNVATYVGLACFVVLALGAFALGWGLNAVVVATLIGRLCRTGIAYWFLYRSAISHRDGAGPTA